MESEHHISPKCPNYIKWNFLYGKILNYNKINGSVIHQIWKKCTKFVTFKWTHQAHCKVIQVHQRGKTTPLQNTFKIKFKNVTEETGPSQFAAPFYNGLVVFLFI